jgi:UDP-N-acetylglucosamine--N-acetylmuramyl-(pentapeptide) pyrophosphoryl-undecaprenol N-acetylglucosamine transferase
VDAGAAILIPESQMSPENVAAQINAVLDNPKGALQMASAALGVAKPDATEQLVYMVETLAQKGTAQ